jgi:hypothetical protein
VEAILKRNARCCQLDRTSEETGFHILLRDVASSGAHAQTTWEVGLNPVPPPFAADPCIAVLRAGVLLGSPPPINLTLYVYAKSSAHIRAHNTSRYQPKHCGLYKTVLSALRVLVSVNVAPPNKQTNSVALSPRANAPSSPILVVLMMEEILSSETSVLT